MSPKKPQVALIYDFDGTLSPSYMQEYDFMDAIGLTDKESFWKASHGLAEKQQSSTILAYMKLMVDKAQENGISIRRQQFVEFGRGIGFFPGVEQWFELINRKGEEMGVNVEHYIISSGLYFGDGETDIPSMRIVKSEGGRSIAIYKPESDTSRAQARNLVQRGRVNFACPGDYREGSELYNAVIATIATIKTDSEFHHLERRNQKSMLED